MRKSTVRNSRKRFRSNLMRFMSILLSILLISAWSTPHLLFAEPPPDPNPDPDPDPQPLPPLGSGPGNGDGYSFTGPFSGGFGRGQDNDPLAYRGDDSFIGLSIVSSGAGGFGTAGGGGTGSTSPTAGFGIASHSRRGGPMDFHASGPPDSGLGGIGISSGFTGFGGGGGGGGVGNGLSKNEVEDSNGLGPHEKAVAAKDLETNDFSLMDEMFQLTWLGAGSFMPPLAAETDALSLTPSEKDWADRNALAVLVEKAKDSSSEIESGQVGRNDIQVRQGIADLHRGLEQNHNRGTSGNLNNDQKVATPAYSSSAN